MKSIWLFCLFDIVTCPYYIYIYLCQFYIHLSERTSISLSKYMQKESAPSAVFMYIPNLSNVVESDLLVQTKLYNPIISIYLSIHPSIYLSVHPSINLFWIHDMFLLILPLLPLFPTAPLPGASLAEFRPVQKCAWLFCHKVDTSTWWFL